MRWSKSFAVAAIAVALCSGVARADWSADQVEQTAQKLAERIAMPVDKAQPVLDRLRERLGDGDLLAHVSGVVAYQMGEGGLILKVKKGKGVVRWKRGGEATFELKSLSVGAMVGGSSEWGVGVILDLSRDDAFGGKYKGVVKGATAGDASVNVSDLRRADTSDPTMAHHLILIGSATGLSANAGEASLTITVQR